MANYLFQTASAHYFRRTIPLDLRPVFGIREMRYSLGTIRKRDAKRVAKRLAAATSLLFEQTRLSQSSVDKNQIKNSLKSYIDQLLAKLPPAASLIAPVADSNAFFPTPTTIVQRPKAKPKKPKGILLKDVVHKFCAENERENWTEKSAQEARANLQLFLDFAGEKVACSEINHDLVNSYKEALLKLPANRGKVVKYRGKSIKQLLNMNCTPMSLTTANKHLGKLSGLLSYAQRHGYVKENYAANKAFKKKQKASEERGSYTTEELKKLLHSEQYREGTHAKPFQFWSPLIALFTGMRVNEIAQLHLDDIYQEDGIWLISNNLNTPDKKLKNDTAARRVPLHPFLTEKLRLPQYVEKLRSEGHDRLFPEITPHRDGYGQRISRWFNGDGKASRNIGYRRKCGIDSGIGTDKKDFHSFRHTVIDHLKQKLGQGVEEVCLHYVMGHDLPNSQTYKRYGNEFKVSTLYKTVTQFITFDEELDLTSLRFDI
ncbi:site-specific integrase [Halodesulfovibrio sp.]|uniref:site-specific integrase n=1 Tax=Halodesulfovibrio sp. TaxID=1912772 RepID=UPI0025FDCCBC|nr:site-specific integrase [Halodesulfovibrio sp.]MCT4627242.1 site-specific integrase [Halodesulfovibrio sp.]